MNFDLLKIELERDEGKKLKPYHDTVGKLTIGIGRNLDDVGLSDEEADFMLGNDINMRVIPGLNQHLPWWVRLNDSRQRVLANMAFNLGIDGLMQFKHMLDAVKVGDYAKAADEMMDSLWTRQTGERAARLSTMMRSGT